MNLNMMSKFVVAFKGWTVCFTCRLIEQSLHKSLVKVTLYAYLFLLRQLSASATAQLHTGLFSEGSPIYGSE